MILLNHKKNNNKFSRKTLPETGLDCRTCNIQVHDHVFMLYLYLYLYLNHEKNNKKFSQKILPHEGVDCRTFDFPVLLSTTELPQHVLSATEIKMIM